MLHNISLRQKMKFHLIQVHNDEEIIKKCFN